MSTVPGARGAGVDPAGATAAVQVQRELGRPTELVLVGRAPGQVGQDHRAALGAPVGHRDRARRRDRLSRLSGGPVGSVGIGEGDGIGVTGRVIAQLGRAVEEGTRSPLAEEIELLGLVDQPRGLLLDLAGELGREVPPDELIRPGGRRRS